MIRLAALTPLLLAACVGCDDPQHTDREIRSASGSVLRVGQDLITVVEAALPEASVEGEMVEPAYSDANIWSCAAPCFIRRQQEVAVALTGRRLEVLP